MKRRDGFMTEERNTGEERHPSVRTTDYEEYKGRFTEDEAKRQASRCMDCGTPFCHVGETFGAVRIGCPVYNLIPEWNGLVEDGNFEEALHRLHQTNNFPEFTGRVCPAPCEGSCTLAIHRPAVAIKQIERTIIDIGFENGWVKARKPSVRTPFKIAVVGSGPAGLAAADQLNQAGHSVTVFEREDRAGGLLTYGIPAMKLDKKVVERRISLLEEEGIRFKLNFTVGVDETLDSLKSRFDAVILCIGATEPRKLETPVKSGLVYAMDYLTASTKHHLDGKVLLDEHDAKDKDIIVIGGGDTGADCVATALRQRCKSVVQFGKHEEAPATRSDDNMWPDTPNVFTLDYGYEEAMHQFGKDPREYLIQVERYATSDDGRLNGVWTVRNEKVRNSDGSVTFSRVDGTEQFFPADLIYVAIGFSGVEQEQVSIHQVEGKAGKIATTSYETSIPGVFAAGDARRGQSLVVWAIREGREVAKAVEERMMKGIEKTG
ncbi:glutamate synthase subunit beta [Exiguobacterium flavidum]|uniref:glutamate synthase subunit beta n=1 Tax=Exiguobacterium flavidum TaxID=2184695 RepID=UPI000DF72962|nr:glutamate synthase subunit beta [Exiguobacterium flavidum]